MTSFIVDKEIETEYGTICLKENRIEFDGYDGKKHLLKISKRISKYMLIGDFPLYLIIIYENGVAYSIEIPTLSQIKISTNDSIEIVDIVPFPSTHCNLILLVDKYDAVLIFDNSYRKTLLYAPSLPSHLKMIEYFHPLCVLLFEYDDGRSFVWSLDSGSYLMTLQYSSPQERTKSTIIYQHSN